ncbi:class I SAM-dependent rRNA methyltransferase [Mesotoga prima]|uniref:class I SAM-dependent rRNA methyltransferase n=1 Tax=Mesotoga prima TaxID=1184387 RepID=UPI002C3BEA26|nr:class I SAM-dependent rRNA methyltransferase [Mesotoga prima]HQC14323.1 class I SAM-dependent rRNA methyltransferase [Mesotoga prima]
MSARVVLKRSIKRRIAFGHPWIYDNEIEKADFVEGGCIVDVLTNSGQFLGRGYYNPDSSIRVRLLTRRNCSIDTDFFAQKLKRSLGMKSSLLRYGNALRVTFGEADGLPGLIVDKFSDWLVVQFNTLGIGVLKNEIIEALIATLKPKGIFEKSEGISLTKEGLESKEGWLFGNGPELLPFSLNGIHFFADTKGQKTGFFLDQRDNAENLSKYANGRNVLDVFSYTGNFSFHCLSQGANRATLVDSSERALSVARETAEINGFISRCEFVRANAFDYLREESLAGHSLVIVDPPAMAKSPSSKKSALRGYKELNLRVIKKAVNGSLLASSSCTQIISEDDWMRTINDAFHDSKKVGIVSFRGGQPLDHPEVSSIFETRYLKFCLFRVIELCDF